MTRFGTWRRRGAKREAAAMSMIVKFSAHGDVDRLPHKDILERIERAVNEIVEEAQGKAGLPHYRAIMATKRVERRALSGNDAYVVMEHEGEAEMSFGVHLP